MRRRQVFAQGATSLALRLAALLALGLPAWGGLAAAAQPGPQYQAYTLTMEAANLIRAGDYEGAEQKLASALRLAPASFDATYYMAYACERQGRLDEAIAWYKKAVPLEKGRHQAIFGVARLYYARGDYKEALPLLVKLAGEYPVNEHTYEGYLLLARCYAETGDGRQAAVTFDRALTVRANDAAGWRLAAQELDYIGDYSDAVRYYKEYLRRFPAAADSKAMADRLEILSYADERTERLKEVQHGFKFDADTDDLRDFLVFRDPVDRGVSDLAVAQVLSGLKDIPRTYRHQLEAAGYKVLLVPRIEDALPQLAGSSPRGFGSGTSWHNANGTFDRARKLIVVAEKIDIAGGASGQEALVDETVQHEFGHAYDHFIGEKRLPPSARNPYPEISQGEQFSRAYELDLASFPAELRDKFAYFLQPGGAGKEELFAQMFPIFFGNAPRPGSYEEYFKLAFPNVLRLIAEARKNDPDYERLRDLYDVRLRQNLLLPSERAHELIGP